MEGKNKAKKHIPIKANKIQIASVLILFLLLTAGAIWTYAGQYTTGYKGESNIFKIKIYDWNGNLLQTRVLQIKGSDGKMTYADYVKQARSISFMNNYSEDNWAGTSSSSTLPHVTDVQLAYTTTINNAYLTGYVDGNGTPYYRDTSYQYIKMNVTLYIPAHYKYNGSTKEWETGGAIDYAYDVRDQAQDTMQYHQTYGRYVTCSFIVNTGNIGLTNLNSSTYLSGTAVLKLNFTRPSYTVTFADPQNGNSSYSLLCGDGVSAPAPTDKENIKFVGWYDGYGSNANILAFTGTWVSVCGGDRTLYAHWENDCYNINYNNNGGSGSISPTTVDLSGTGNVTLASSGSFSRSKYHFKEWNTASDGNGTSYREGASIGRTVLSSTAGKDATLYAIWVSDNYNIIFNANGGSGTMNTQSAARDKDAKINAMSGFTRKDYTFIGWSKDQFVSDPEYKDKGVIPVNTISDKDETLILYAIWRKNGTGFVQVPMLSDRMFYNDRDITGQNGTTYDDNYTDANRAHIDTDEDPGYFSVK